MNCKKAKRYGLHGYNINESIDLSGYDNSLLRLSEGHSDGVKLGGLLS